MISDFINRFCAFLNRHAPIFIVTPWIQNFGNCAEDMYYALLKARRERRKVLFLIYKELYWKLRRPIANRELLAIQSEYIIDHRGRPFIAVAEWVVTILYRFLWVGSLVLRRIFRASSMWCPNPSRYAIPTIGRQHLWQPEGVRVFSCDAICERRWREEYANYLPVAMREPRRQKAEAIRREELGIPMDDWFVCLHVREPGFHRDAHRDPCRNASIRNYLEGIRVITKAGGWVVRIGDPTMSPLPPLWHVVDYVHTPWYSALMDLYLISQCRFLVGTNSGPQIVARLFQKRELLVNVCEWIYTYPLRQGDRHLLKHVYSKSRGRSLSLQEVFEAPLDCLYYFFTETSDYSLEENTSEEICDAVREFLARPVDAPLTPLQVEANTRRHRQVHRWLSEGFLMNGRRSFRVDELYRIGATLGGSGALSHSYLERNWKQSGYAIERKSA